MQKLEDSDRPSNPALEITTSIGFNEWLNSQGCSLAFTTYQVGKVFLIGLQSNGRLSVFERTFDRSMGLWTKGSTLYLSSLYQIWGFQNALQTGDTHEGYDCLYVPQISYVTGNLNIHDLVVDSSDRLIFANTLFNCLATTSNNHSFTPLWQPDFISSLAAEDRCHLNGIALENGEVRYITTISQTDTADSWRDRRHDGGCVIDIQNDRIVAKGLSMPHSPRCYGGKLWLLNSGTGDFGFIDLQQGSFEPLIFCPGYLRGCAFINNYAIVGLSQARNKTFTGLMLDEKLQQAKTEAFCGLAIVDLNRGEIVAWLRLEGVVKELYDIAVIPGIKRPMAIGLKSDLIQRMVTIG